MGLYLVVTSHCTLCLSIRSTYPVLMKNYVFSVWNNYNPFFSIQFPLIWFHPPYILHILYVIPLHPYTSLHPFIIHVYHTLYHTHSPYTDYYPTTGEPGYGPHCWIRCSSWRECTWLAATEEREAMVTGENIRHLLSVWTRAGHTLFNIRLPRTILVRVVMLRVLWFLSHALSYLYCMIF